MALLTLFAVTTNGSSQESMSNTSSSQEVLCEDVGNWKRHCDVKSDKSSAALLQPLASMRLRRIHDGPAGKTDR
jgi:hypothetical protein